MIEWISVEDRLPEGNPTEWGQHGKYLVLCSSQGKIMDSNLAFYGRDCGWVLLQGYSFVGPITHWAEITPPEDFE